MNSNSELTTMLDAHRAVLTQATVEALVRARPGLFERFGASGKAKCAEDTQYHLQYLSGAIAASDQTLFVDYIAWVKVMLAARNIRAEDLSLNLTIIRDAVAEHLPAPLAAIAAAYVDAALVHLSSFPSDLPALSDGDNPLRALKQDYIHALLTGKRQQASALIVAAAETGTGVRDIYMHVFQPSQYEIGRLWQTNVISVAEEHYCTAATQNIMSFVSSGSFKGERNGHRLVATCVSGELHDIGIRMVSDFLEMDGWETYFLGANTPTQSVIHMLRERKTELLAISATIPLHVRGVSNLIDAVRANGACGGVKILVGGYPFNANPALWKDIGADGSARSAQEAIALSTLLLQ